MKNFKKLVSFVFVTIAAFVLGFTAISADAPSTVTVTANTSTPDGWWIHPNLSLVKYNKATGDYVFCLDSGKDVDLNVPLKYSSSLYSDKVAAVNKIINKAYNLGLGSSNQWGISDKDFYGITQSAVWLAVHGESAGGYTDHYKNWIASHGYQDVFNTIYSAVGESIVEPTVSFEGNGTLTESGNYMVSGDIKVVANNVLSDLTLSVKNGQVKVNGSWTSKDVTVKNGDVIKVRVKKPSEEGTVSTTISVKSSDFTSGYNTYFYETATAGKQNIGVVVPNTVSVSDSMELSGNFEKKEVFLDVSKTDATGQKELPGAKLTLKDSTGKEIDSWVSTTEEHRVSGLEIGAIYEIIEDYAPKGYQPLQNSIKFVLNADGSVTTCNIKNVDGKDVCEAMSTEDILKIKNEVTKLDVSKTDATGQKELPGAKLTIKDSTGKEIDSWISTTEEHRVSGLEIGAIYEIIEDYAPEGYQALQNSIKFVLNADGTVTTCNIKNVKGKDVCEAMSTEDILKIKNEVIKDEPNNVVISKKDFTTGEEIPGAHLQILDENGNVVIEWTSTDKPYEFTLEPGKYVLVETLPATDYNAEMIIEGNRTSRYEFEVVEGEITKIEVYNEIIGVPRTGVSAAGVYTIGGFVMLAGISLVIYAKKKEMI